MLAWEWRAANATQHAGLGHTDYTPLTITTPTPKACTLRAATLTPARSRHAPRLPTHRHTHPHPHLTHTLPESPTHQPTKNSTPAPHPPTPPQRACSVVSVMFWREKSR